MAKAEWGTKRICPNCGVRYYDMKKKHPACPECGTVFDPEILARSRRGRAVAEDKSRKTTPTPDIIDDLPRIEIEESDEVVIEDADELGDDMDVEEVIDVDDVKDDDHG